MSVIGSNILAGASGQAVGYQVSRSLRFNSSDSAYLSRTPASAGNRKTWTWAAWVKRSKLGTGQTLFRGGAGTTNSTYVSLYFRTDDAIDFGGWVSNFVRTPAVFRDCSAWYHIMLAVDTTLSSNRIRLYVNGVEQTLTQGAGYPAQNDDLGVNQAALHTMGGNDAAGGYSDLYLADVHLIDGQQLTPSSFTEVSATTGQLIPKAYTGSFGTNGFWLKFSDNSNNTATTLGKDTSGNGNNWTPNNFSVSTSTTVYTNNFSISGTLFPGSSLANAFDGNIATSATVTNAAQNQTLTFAPSPGIAYTSGVEVYLTPTGDVSVTRYSFNGGADQSFAAGDGWKTVASGSGTLTSLVIKQGAQGNSVGISAIRINGTTILVDNAARNNDSLVDTPTSYGTDTGAGGDVRGNYATLNPLQSSATLSNGNLDCSTTSTSWQANVGTVFQSSGKWYAEFTVSSIGAGGIHIGIVGPNYSVAAGNYIGNTATSYAYRADGTKFNNATQTSYGASYTTNDVIGVAMDLDAGTLVFYKNGVSQGTAYSGMTGEKAFAVSVGSTAGTHSVVFNAGSRPFAYTAPSGFKALCDTNLPAPANAKPNEVMDVKLWTGTGSGNTQTISGFNFSPDFIWTKARSNASAWHMLMDQVRGTRYSLSSNVTNAEVDRGVNHLIVGADSISVSGDHTNFLNTTYVGWTWDAGTSTVTNTQGSITSSVRANASAGFSIVTYTGNGTNNATVGHSLGVAPELVLFKRRSGTAQDWGVYHVSGGRKNLRLNTTGAYLGGGATYWDAIPTSTVIYPDNVYVADHYQNVTGETYVAYCWAPVVGYSAMGSYVGNSSADGPFVYTGFRPRFIMIKNADATTDWVIVDTARETYNVVDDFLRPNSSAAEGTRANLAIDILSNGFKQRGLDNFMNGSNTHIYAAFAESPFQYARAR